MQWKLCTLLLGKTLNIKKARVSLFYYFDNYFIEFFNCTFKNIVNVLIFIFQN